MSVPIHTVHPHAIPMVANMFGNGDLSHDDYPGRQAMNLVPIPVFFENFHPACRQAGPTLTTVSWIPAFVEVMN